MNKKKCVVLFMLAFMLIASMSGAFAAVQPNPFTVKNENEFTKEDRERFEEDLQKEFEQKMENLEKQISSEIRDIRKTNVDLRRQQQETQQKVEQYRYAQPIRQPGPGVDMPMDLSNMDPSMVGIQPVNIPSPMVNQQTPTQKKIANASFIGCFDDQVLFKDDISKEQFFVAIEEVKDNEEFNKMGGCSF